MTSLDEKINKHFSGKAVRKDLTQLVKGNAVVPTYVLEYLLGQYCATDDEESIQGGVEMVKNIIAKNYVNRDETELIKTQIADGKVTKIIDRVQATFNEDKGIAEASFTNLGIKKVPLHKKFTESYPKMLTGGIWAIISIGYITPEKGESPWIVENIKPIQISNIDFEEFTKERANFSTDEWKQVLMQTLGLNIEQFSPKQVLLQLTRLIPFCERNYNLMELGPKGTGKSYVYSEFSPHGILISGGEVTAAKLFVNNTSNAIGLVGVWDTVAFDEFAGKDKKVSKDLVDIMKNYMANRTFSRGKESIGADGSMVFVGNTKRSVAYMMKHADLFEPLPKSYYDSAFLDRIHCYLPGWKVDIIRGNMFSNGFGFIVDYYAEILHHLRKHDYSESVRENFDLDPTLSERDKVAILKTYGGLIKILFPHNEFSIDESKEILEFAMECRRRVKVQLEKMDETFREKPAHFKYSYKGQEKEVITLEEIEYNSQLQPDTDHDDGDSTLEPTKKAIVLKEETIYIQDGQKGVSYKTLFADYLNGAKEIHVIDSYIRKFYQIKNLFELLKMIAEITTVGEEVKVKLFTVNDHKEPDQEANLMKLESSLQGTGVDFEFSFIDSGKIHGRHIETDTGWDIILDAGLDMFQIYDFKNPFELANTIQEERKCKQFYVTYNRVGKS